MSNSLRRIKLALIKKMKFLPIKLYLESYYEYYVGKKIDLNNPIEFNQKIQWLKAYYRPAILTQLVDKYEVRKYVEETVGAKYLNTLIKVYEKVSEINFDELPKQFVIKAVHGYHFNLIVEDKTKLNRFKSKLLMTKWMSKNQYTRGGLEWAYKNVKPKLIAEKYLIEMGKASINDYKFFCFNGEPKFIQVDLDRSIEHLRCFYDIKWKKIENLTTKGIKEYDGILEKPKNYDEMLDVTKKLANKFPFVRVDLYNIDGNILFGEMTFYPTDGRMDFAPEEYNTIIGDYMSLPTIPKNKKYITNI